jgi:hypothetical protein
MKAATAISGIAKPRPCRGRGAVVQAGTCPWASARISEPYRGRLISMGVKLEGWLTTRSFARLCLPEFTNIPPQKAKDVMACWRFLSLSFIFDVSFH